MGSVRWVWSLPGLIAIDQAWVLFAIGGVDLIDCDLSGVGFVRDRWWCLWFWDPVLRSIRRGFCSRSEALISIFYVFFLRECRSKNYAL
jgi:hypothetical protein